jgi:hypothetical protein
MTRPTTDELQVIPGVGPAVSGALRRLGYTDVASLRGADPLEMYNRYCHLTGEREDPCVLYVFRCATYFAEEESPDPELLKWWNWKNRAFERESGPGPGPGSESVS